LRLTLIAVIYLAIFILLDLVTKQFSELPGIVAWYPPAGLTYALLLVFGIAFTPAVTIALLVDSILIYRMPQSSFLLILWAIIISLIYGAAALFLRKPIHLDWQLKKLRDVVWLIVTTVLVSALLAILSVLSSSLSGGVPGSEIFHNIFHWWIGETVGVLTVTPFLLIYVMPGLKRFIAGEPDKATSRRAFPRLTLTAVGQAASIVLTLYWVFIAQVSDHFRPLFLIALPLIWIALQRGFKGIAAAILVLNSGIVLALVLFQFDLSRLEELELTMIIISVVSLLMGAVVTERRHSQEALVASDGKLKLLFDNLDEMFFSIDTLHHKIIEISPACKNVYGRSPGDFYADPGLWTEVVYPEDRGVMQSGNTVLAAGHPLRQEYRILRPDGEIRWVEARANPFFDDTGHLNRFDGVISDITERKQSEKALRESEQRFRLLIENSSDIVLILNPDLTLAYISPSAERILGYSVPSLIGAKITDYVASQDLPDLIAATQYRIQTPGPSPFLMQIRVRHANGSLRILEGMGSNLLDQPGVSGLVINARDITERKKNEEQIQILSQIPDESPNPIMRVTKGGSLLYANPMSEPLLSKWKTHLGKHLPIGLRSKIQKVFSTGKYQEVEVQTKEKVYSLILAPIVDAGYVNLYGRDITQRKQAEESSRHHLKDLEMLYENSLRINRFLNVEKIGRQVIDTVLRKGLSWRHVAIFLFHPEKQRVEMLVNSYPGIKTEKEQAEKLRLTNLVTNPKEGLVGWVIQNGRPIRDGNVNKDKRYIMAYPDIRSGVYVPMLVGDRVIGVISVESEQTDAYTEADERLLLTIAAQASVALENARLFSEIENSHLYLTLAYDETIEGWSKALDYRDKETEGHSKRVTELSWKLARKLGMKQTELLNIRWGALLHDIGKMGIPDAILLKPSSLTDLEWMIMKKHTIFAFDWLSPIAYLQKALDIPYCHHEKWDGTGYPRGLKGEEIPLPARLFAVVDVYDALISDRPYRKAWTKAKALDYIEEQSGIHFDPKVVSKFKKIIEKINKSESG
jgi:PAS domain S-box-containing protein/putative nucleotidyltransferase with HDIG domain